MGNIAAARPARFAAVNLVINSLTPYGLVPHNFIGRCKLKKLKKGAEICDCLKANQEVLLKFQIVK